MKPQLIITQIREEENNTKDITNKEIQITSDNIFIPPQTIEIDMSYSINIKGSGDFSKYFDEKGKFLNLLLLADIFNGNINLVGKNNMI